MAHRETPIATKMRSFICYLEWAASQAIASRLSV
jgi:hypothetical protein